MREDSNPDWPAIHLAVQQKRGSCWLPPVNLRWF